MAVLLFLLLFGGEVRAQFSPTSTGMGARRVELAPEEPPKAIEVAISPGLSSALFFDSELVQESVDFEGRDRFSLVDIGRTTIRLIPSERISSGERLRLIVRFRDESAPASATFLLVMHPAKAELVVEVYRQKRGVESYREEAREARAEAHRYREELARLRAERNSPGGLAGLISTGAMNPHGVEGRDLLKAITQAAGSPLAVRNAYGYRSARRVAVEVGLDFPEGARPWTARDATLRGKSGEELKILQVWQDTPVPSEKFIRVVIEAEATADAARGIFTLKLWEANGPRTVTLGNVTFP
nr:DUF2381 family protein [Myxococcus sp. CA039A]